MGRRGGARLGNGHTGRFIGKPTTTIIQKPTTRFVRQARNHVRIPRLIKARVSLNTDETEFCLQKGIKFIGILGKGCFGTVWLVSRTTNVETKYLACKILNHFPLNIIDKDCMREFIDLTQEVSILSTLTHPNIVEYDDHFVSIKRTDPVSRNPYCRVLTFMEVCQDTLLTLIYGIQGFKFTENHAKAMLRDVSAGLKYLHDQNICHLDIKPDNIMFNQQKDGTYCYKLTDFGIAQRFDPGTSKDDMRFGDTRYLAPEVEIYINHNITDFDRKPLDIYSLGCTLVESLLRYDSLANFIGEINKGTPVEDVFHKYGLTTACGSLILCMMLENPKDRPTVEKLCACFFLRP